MTNDERSVTSHPTAHVMSSPRSHLFATIATHHTLVTHAPVHKNDVIALTDLPGKTEARHARSSTKRVLPTMAMLLKIMVHLVII